MVARSQLCLGRSDAGAKLTHRQFAEAVYDEPWRYERVKGRLVVMAPSGDEHVNTGEPIRDQFVAYKLAHPDKISNVVNEAWIVIDENTDRIADLAVYFRKLRSGKVIPYLIPDIVFETASAGYTSLKRDYEEKRHDYFRAGVRGYVIVDRFEHRVTVLRRGRGRYVETVLGPDDAYTTPLLPGLKIPLVDVI